MRDSVNDKLTTLRNRTGSGSPFEMSQRAATGSRLTLDIATLLNTKPTQWFLLWKDASACTKSKKAIQQTFLFNLHKSSHSDGIPASHAD
jgi:hypothetical protein